MGKTLITGFAPRLRQPAPVPAHGVVCCEGGTFAVLQEKAQRQLEADAARVWADPLMADAKIWRVRVKPTCVDELDKLDGGAL